MAPVPRHPGERSAPIRRSVWARRALLAAVLTAFAAPAAASATTYYVAPSGDDAAAGTSPAAPWASLGRIGAAALAPGDQVLLRRGGTWSGSLKLTRSGTPAAPVTLGAYGAGPGPAIAGGGCLTMAGAYQVVTDLEIRNCTRWGVYVTGSHVTVDRNFIHDNVAGVSVDSASSMNRITHNRLVNNNRLDASPGSGAFGVLLNGSDNVVAANVIQGSDTPSPVYGRDGSAVEVYRGQRNLVTRNLAIDNLTFSELGNSASRDNTFSYNVVRGSIPTQSFLITRGSGNSYGPVYNTRVFNNTVVFTGAQAEGFVCQSCGTDILTLRNNILSAPKKVGYAQGPVDEDFDLFLGGGIRQFGVGPHSFVGDPRWVDRAGADFRLGAGSPAIDRGQSQGPQIDFAGVKVPQGGAPDLGAFEWTAPPASLGARLTVARALRRSVLVSRGLAVGCGARVAARCRIVIGFSLRDARRVKVRGEVRNGVVAIGARTLRVTGRRTRTGRVTVAASIARTLRGAPRVTLTLRAVAVVTSLDGRTSRVRRAIRLLPG